MTRDQLVSELYKRQSVQEAVSTAQIEEIVKNVFEIVKEHKSDDVWTEVDGVFFLFQPIIKESEIKKANSRTKTKIAEGLN